MFLKQLVNASVLFILAFSLVPFNEQLLSFKRRQQRQLGEFARRVGNQFRQNRPQVAYHSADRFNIEPLAVIDRIQLQFSAGKGKQGERVVGSRKDCPYLLDVEFGLESEIPWAISGIVLKNKNTLKQRRPCRHLAPTMDVQQRRMLVLARFDCLELKFLKPGEEISIRSETGANGNRVDEQANRRLEVPKGRTKNNVISRAVTPQQQRPRALHQSEHCQPMLPRKGP